MHLRGNSAPPNSNGGDQQTPAPQVFQDRHGQEYPSGSITICIGSPPIVPPVFEIEYFRNYNDWTGSYKQHNTALKWFRQLCERSGETLALFSNTEPEEVAELVHPKGPTFSFIEEIMYPWKWQEMVAQLDNDDMRFVVEGAGPIRSRGLVRCQAQSFAKYDHKRHHADPTLGEMLHTWDFILTRDDGSVVALHPSYSNTKLTCKCGVPNLDLELPNSGLGGTSGPGTFKYFKDKQVERTLRFDARKILQGEHRTQGGQHRSRGARARCTSWTDVSHAPGEVL
jgi:hypothetical protein